MNHPVVSIIMPARNVEKYIGDAVRSVLKQSYDYWELIIVENDSSDKTYDAAAQFRDERIRLMQTSTPGLSHARNIGLREARGEFICFLDADDLLPPHSLSSRIELFIANPEVDFVDGNVEVYNYDLSTLRYTWRPSFRGNPYREMALLNPRCFSGITWMIRKSSIEGIQFDTTWTHLEDRLFFITIATKGNYDYVGESVYCIRRRPGSLMANLSALEKAYVRFMKHVYQLGLYDESTRRRELKLFHKMFYRTYLKHLQPVKASWHLIRRIRKRKP
jgi:glycosyltransferase involved in cell wall biosynthesis